MLEYLLPWMNYIKWSLISLQILLIAITSMLVKVDKLREELSNQKILIITAYPDEESLYFGPLILMLQHTNCIRLLCLSNGNSRDIGRLREQELSRTVKYLGLQGHRLIDDSLLQDEPNAE